MKFTKTIKILVIKYKYEYEINVLKIWQVSAFTSEPWLKTKFVKLIRSNYAIMYLNFKRMLSVSDIYITLSI